jgi:hypothetical protein
MWLCEKKQWPAIGQQVVGVVERDGRFDEVAWWTRTVDGWYVSDTRGNLGNRDAMTAASSKGPHWWHPAPATRAI